MNKTLYIRVCDEETWKTAEELAPNNDLPSLVSGLLACWVEEEQTQREGYKQITVRVFGTGTLPTNKVFTGKWIAQELVYGNTYYSIALTQRDNVAIYQRSKAYATLLWGQPEKVAANMDLPDPIRKLVREALETPEKIILDI